MKSLEWSAVKVSSPPHRSMRLPLCSQCPLSSLCSGEGPIHAGTLPVWSEVADGVGCCVCCCLCVAQLLLGHGIWFHSGNITFSFPGLGQAWRFGKPVLSQSYALLAGNRNSKCSLSCIDSARFFTLISGGEKQQHCNNKHTKKTYFFFFILRLFF